MIEPYALQDLLDDILRAEIIQPDEAPPGEDPGPIRDQMADLIARWELTAESSATLWKLVAGHRVLPVVVSHRVDL